MTAGLQFALDTLSMAEAEPLAARLEACWDVLEVGTGLLLMEGLAGGLDAKKIARLGRSGVDLFVVGGFLLNADDPENRAGLLKTTLAGF